MRLDYELDAPDQDLILKVRMAIQLEKDGAPARDMLDDEEVVEAFQLLVNILEFYGLISGGLQVSENELRRYGNARADSALIAIQNKPTDEAKPVRLTLGEAASLEEEHRHLSSLSLISATEETVIRKNFGGSAR